MSHFVTDLHVRRHWRDTSTDKRGTWTLLAPLEYVSDLLNRVITVPTGFVTDFASVPRIPIAYLLTGDSGHEAAVVHDFLYTSHEVERDLADAVFREALLCGGEPGWRAWAMWVGVRIGGGGPYHAAGQPQPEHVAAAITAASLEAP